MKVPSVLGDQVVTGWATPCVPYGGQPGQGLFAMPDQGAGVWVEFEEGDLEFPIWVGTFWSKPGGTTEVPVTRDRTGAEGRGVRPAHAADPHHRPRPHHPDRGRRRRQDMILVHEAAHGHTIVLDGEGIMINDGHGNSVAHDRGPGHDHQREGPHLDVRQAT